MKVSVEWDITGAELTLTKLRISLISESGQVMQKFEQAWYPECGFLPIRAAEDLAHMLTVASIEMRNGEEKGSIELPFRRSTDA